MSWDIIEYIIKMWCEEFKCSRKIDYIVSKGKDRKAAGDLLNKFKESKLHKGKNTEQILDALRDFFKDSLLIQDSWYKKNLTLSIINGHINQVSQHIAELRSARRKIYADNEKKKDLDAVGKVFGSEIKEAAASTVYWKPKENKKRKNPRLTKVQFIQQYGADEISKWPEYKENME